MTPRNAAVLAALALGASLATAQNANQGVSKNEITLGSIQDLSGPIAGFGKQVRLGMLCESTKSTSKAASTAAISS
jgi:branched-chain amino acid transport system substrate-binding protein